MSRIVIVEDSYIVGLHLKATLENEGFAVPATFSSAEEVLEFLKTNEVELVLMDIMLSQKLDGVEAAAIIKRKFNIPVIFITALSDKATIDRAKITEPFGFLTKPFQDHELITVINIALYKHSIERKLIASEAKYFSTLNSLHEAVIVIDNNLIVTYINPTAEAITRIPTAKAVGKNVLEILTLKNETSGEVIANPLLCQLDGSNWNSILKDMVLYRENQPDMPIGDGSMNVLLNDRSEITGLVIVFRDVSEKKRYENKIRNLEKQKISFLIEGQENERSRVSKDMHDGLGQILNVIKMNAYALIERNQETEILFALIDDAIQECVRISENLLPSKLKDFDLTTCIRSLCNQFLNAQGTQIKFNGSHIAKDIDQICKINLYRITQEALTNAIKHAQAEMIEVGLTEIGSELQLTIADNGKGLLRGNANDLFKNNGLVNIRDRVDMLGGRLNMESNAGVGTKIVVQIPLKSLIG